MRKLNINKNHFKNKLLLRIQLRNLEINFYFSDGCKAVQSFDLLLQIAKNSIFLEIIIFFCFMKELKFIVKKFPVPPEQKTTLTNYCVCLG